MKKVKGVRNQILATWLQSLTFDNCSILPRSIIKFSEGQIEEWRKKMPAGKQAKPMELCSPNYANNFEMQTLHAQVGGLPIFSAMRQFSSTKGNIFRFPFSSCKCYRLDIQRRKKNLTCYFSHYLRGKEYSVSNPFSHERHYWGASAKAGLSVHFSGTGARVLSSDSSNFCDNTIFRELRF